MDRIGLSVAADTSPLIVNNTGDMIMLFVSFPSSSEHVSAKDRLDGGQSKSATKEQKPSVIIELLDDEKPYKVIEKQKECVDLASDNEKENRG